MRSRRRARALLPVAVADRIRRHRDSESATCSARLPHLVVRGQLLGPSFRRCENRSRPTFRPFPREQAWRPTSARAVGVPRRRRCAGGVQTRRELQDRWSVASHCCNARWNWRASATTMVTPTSRSARHRAQPVLGSTVVERGARRRLSSLVDLYRRWRDLGRQVAPLATSDPVTMPASPRTRQSRRTFSLLSSDEPRCDRAALRYRAPAPPRPSQRSARPVRHCRRALPCAR